MNLRNISLEIKGTAAFIRLQRPPMNVIDITTIDEINFTLEQIHTNPKISLIVFSAAGEKAFSTGVDIKDHTLDKVETMLTSFHRIFRFLSQTEKLTLASVQGYCLGGGMELISVCDFVIASDNAVFGQPEIKVGCYPPVAAAWLPKLIGPRRAMEICMLGETITAREALSIGLINKVVPTDLLAVETDTMIAQILNLSGAVTQYTKRALMAGNNKSFAEALDAAETIYLKELVTSEDLTEGIEAFTQKRMPKWKNQ